MTEAAMGCFISLDLLEELKPSSFEELILVDELFPSLEDEVEE